METVPGAGLYLRAVFVPVYLVHVSPLAPLSICEESFGEQFPLVEAKRASGETAPEETGNEEANEKNARGGSQLSPEDFARLAFSKDGCREAQRILAGLDDAEALSLVGGLRDFVAQAAKSQYANFLLQQVVRRFKPDKISFVIEELRADALRLCNQKCACRVYKCLVPYADESLEVAALFDYLLDDIHWVASGTYGRYVIEEIFKAGPLSMRQRVMSSVTDELPLYAGIRSSYIILVITRHGTLEEKQAVQQSVGKFSRELNVRKCGRKIVQRVNRMLLRT